MLERGLRVLDLEAALAAPLSAYLAELSKWTRAYNLTAVRNAGDMVTRHILDSLAVLAQADAVLPAEAWLLDVGSGAGLPAIPLALARPRWTVHALDSNGKKARFLRHAQRTLGLGNLAVIESRAESHAAPRPYDGVISRAFSALGDFVRATEPLLAADGAWLAMKARIDSAELDALPSSVRVQASPRLDVPGLDEERHLVILRRAGDS